MAGGYKAPRDGMEKLTGALGDQRERLRELERPTGTSYASLVDWVRQTLANITAQVNTIATNWMAANAYTKGQVDTLVANPPSGSNVTGNVTASGNVTANGRVISAGVVNSPGTKANTVTVGYSAVYIDSSGNMGGNTSSRRFKQDISVVKTDVPGFLGLKTYRFRYIDAVEELGDDAPWEFGLMAEDVVKVAPWACFYEDDGITVRGINYDRLIVAAINVLQDHETRLKAAGL